MKKYRVTFTESATYELCIESDSDDMEEIEEQALELYENGGIADCTSMCIDDIKIEEVN